MHYDTVNAMWHEQGGKPCTREEAERAARKLHAHFGRRELGSPNMMYPSRPGRTRRCWIRRPGVRYRTMVGWPRLAHDVSHDIFSSRHPTFRPHDGGHDALELEVSQYILAQGWLDGRLKPKAPAKPTRDEVVALKIARTRAGISRWEGKERRAAKALRKLRQRLKRLEGG